MKSQKLKLGKEIHLHDGFKYGAWGNLPIYFGTQRVGIHVQLTLFGPRLKIKRHVVQGLIGLLSAV